MLVGQLEFFERSLVAPLIKELNGGLGCLGVEEL